MAALAYVQVARPLNVVLSMVGVGVGAALAERSATHGLWPTLAFAMISAGLIAAGANTINDLNDVDIDRVNRPDRPIPSGRLSTTAATVFWLVTTLAGVATSLVLPIASILIAVGVALATYVYAVRLKRLGLPGNLLVSSVVAAAILFGAISVGGIGRAWIGAAAAFILTLARELVKDMEDVDGDALGGVRSLPLVLGVPTVRFIVTVLILSIFPAAVIPYAAAGFSGVYLASVTLAGCALLGVVWFITAPEPALGRASGLLKAAMALGMVGLALA